MNTVYILTGANLGDRLANLQQAAQYLAKETGTIVRSSSIYETEAWGNNQQPDFYNQVHIIDTSLAPEEMMKKILHVEEKMGRVRTVKNASRIIDIDILFFNDEIIQKEDLIIPHAQITNRRFVLTPLDELSPNLVHPVLHKTIHELLFLCKDMLKVKPLKPLPPHKQVRRALPDSF